jgi:hypothetical protein
MIYCDVIGGMGIDGFGSSGLLTGQPALFAIGIEIGLK